MGQFAELGKKYGNKSILSNDGKSSLSSKNGLCDDVLSQNALESSEFEDELLPMSWLNISKIVYEKELYPTDILSVLYSSIHDSCKTVALLINKEKFGKVDLYLGIRDRSIGSNYVSKYVLQKALKGLFPGVAFEERQVLMKELLDDKHISVVSGIPSLRNEKTAKFSQGIERLINASVDIPNYSIIFIAESLTDDLLSSKLSDLENKYSELSSQAELTSSKTDNKTITKSQTTTSGRNSSTSNSFNDSTNKSETITGSITKSDSEGYAFIAAQNSNESSTKGVSKTEGSSISKGSSETSGISSSTAINEGENVTFGNSKQIKEENKTIKNQLKLIDREIERLITSKSRGLWKFNAFFVSDNKLSVNALASLYKGLIIGSESLYNKIDISVLSDKDNCNIVDSLSNLTFPKKLKTGTCLNSDELAVCMNIPQSSVPGILVCEQVSFGRNIYRKENKPIETITLGCLHHLGTDDVQNRLDLDINLLTSHMFISGTTGSGKSNAIYLLLSELKKHGKKFMVIEPAKGEYGHVFGIEEDVTVLGVLPNMGNILKINPFSFPKEIHVEEHIDRLIDIFNACWPMYAAMPSVLKASISNAYKSCGWNLVTSESEYDIFPTIKDVIRELSIYINSSEYSSDSKGDYKGALGTRLDGLTYGIIGNVFNNGDTPAEILFDTNVIIDISRVGSSETKSLIMGLLILKLNEYRISSCEERNMKLQHITVLEEAHNLLKATPFVQSQESSNLAGKSVEMIASSIAEMRTYGEAFIIADQSPALLDRSVIRNTNTKVVFALPDIEDREIASASFSLNESQSSELSKLSTGIAAVYQKGWEEPVLAHFNKFELEQIDKMNLTQKDKINRKIDMLMNCELANLIYDGFTQNNKVHISELNAAIRGADISGASKVKLLNDINTLEFEPNSFAKMMVHFIGFEPFLNASKEKDIKLFENLIKIAIINIVGKDLHIDTLISAYIKGCSNMNTSPFYDAWLSTKK